MKPKSNKVVDIVEQVKLQCYLTLTLLPDESRGGPFFIKKKRKEKKKGGPRKPENPIDSITDLPIISGFVFSSRKGSIAT